MGAMNNHFWLNPPWGNGDRKYRLGLKPIEIDKWLDRAIGKDLLKHKLDLFKSQYNQVVAATTDSNEAQKCLKNDKKGVKRL